MRWLPWALLAMVGWGVWGLLAKHASAGSAVGVAAGAAAVEALVLALAARGGQLSWLTVGIGVAGAVAFWAMFRALSQGPATPVIAVTAMYPVVTMILAVLVIGEALTMRKVVGVAMAVVAVVLLSA